MTKSPWSYREGHHGAEDTELDFSIDELLPSPAPTITTMRADCCVAAAAYLVVLPATSGRPRESELLLCGHHFRAGKEGLRRAKATAYDGHTRKLCTIGG